MPNELFFDIAIDLYACKRFLILSKKGIIKTVTILTMKKVLVEVSARHIHLSQEHLEKLFGREYRLKKLKDLSQPHDFAAEETLEIKVGSCVFAGVRIVGPVREKTQAEFSATDLISCGIKPVIRGSGDLEGSSCALLKGPAGEVDLKEGIIVPQRHLHCSLQESKDLGLKEGDFISLKIDGRRGLTFHNVKVRVDEEYRLAAHIDTDEGNAAGIDKKTEGAIVV